jgi:hypothetical protein
MATQKLKLPYVIVRTQNAGVFAGELVKRTGSEARLKNSRRIWYWDGAASLSELAVSGTSKPEECQFPVVIPVHDVFGVIEVLQTSAAARKSIESVPTWSVRK